MNTESLLEFPCDFPVKVMGHHTEEFHSTVVEIVNRHVDDQPPPTVRPSRDNRFIALTFSIRAESREQIDALYYELTGHELVLFAL